MKCFICNKKLGKLEGLLNCIEKGEGPLQTPNIDHLGRKDALARHFI